MADLHGLSAVCIMAIDLPPQKLEAARAVMNTGLQMLGTDLCSAHYCLLLDGICHAGQGLHIKQRAGVRGSVCHQPPLVM